eukprot:CAMPEP_0201508670 /NCGR_PEP_ID=MMETSP0161_2-20130828/1959_1 /ASSEMBLY_ACC=CAM_ASM_000251 /TAXON_ID=180227 /ORGANISM="Neoparamoeba aestuarina, Strain SoJaBio B1-5/56/2" /LENGTH=220 /DNA_ID=CAMNT_0047903407 /DNA_START=183 /DNA_END=845 /DNA_ORIENTATION=-
MDYDIKTCEDAGLWGHVAKGVVQKTTEDQKFREVLGATAVAFIDGGIEAVAKDIVNIEEVGSLGKTFFPQDIGHWLDLVFSANYSTTAKVFSEWSHRIWLATASDNNDFDAFETISQVADIVSKTTFLTNNSVQSDGSAIGNLYSAFPLQIEATLGNTKTTAAFAQDCVTLAARFDEADYSFCYNADYGRRKCENYNQNVGQITHAITVFCNVLHDSTLY